MFDILTKNLSFSHFTIVFMSWCPRLWVPGLFAWPVRPDTFVESYEQKLRVFVFYDCFHGLLPTILTFHGDLHFYKTWYMFDSYDQKIVVFSFYHCFLELLPRRFARPVRHITFFESYEQKLRVFVLYD